jgi:nitrogen fixation/metabolism regulation signal transduction histidine kinase
VSLLALAAAGATAATALALAWRLHRARRALAAVEQALLSLVERDYSVRLATRADAALAPLAARFNQLGERLREEQGERYQRELLLETVLEATPSAVLLADGAERVVFGNAAARALLAGGDRVDGHALDDLLARAPAELREALAGEHEGLVTIEQSGGAETFHVAQRRFELRYRPHRLLLVEPLTRELSRREAEAWKRAIRIMSHEINNSLAPVASLVHTARRIVGVPEHAERLSQAFDTIADRTRHLQRFLDGYASFARLPRPVRREVPWRSLLEQVRALYPFSVPRELPEQPAFVDPAQLQQVLVNLLKNAVEAGGPPDAIRLAVERADGGQVVEVSDRGAGMSEEVLRQVPVPFYSTKKSGSGLGLPLCREIVEAHGGRLSIESQPGLGTTVRCFLPDSLLH